MELDAHSPAPPHSLAAEVVDVHNGEEHFKRKFAKRKSSCFHTNESGWLTHSALPLTSDVS